MGKKDVDGQVQEVKADAGTDPVPEPETAPDKTTAGAGEPVVAEAVGEDPVVEEAVDLAEQMALDLQQTKDQLLRQAAEFQNYRRRVDKERARWQQRAQIQVIEPMLPTVPIVTAQYQVGETIGTVGILGPMRMDYERVVALVESMAVLLHSPTLDVPS